MVKARNGRIHKSMLMQSVGEAGEVNRCGWERQEK